jgi:sigma-B regulation protein RsbU (phosphoserine phosphatase)
MSLVNRRPNLEFASIIGSRMEASFRYWRLWLRQAGLLPSSRLARAACYFLGLDILLFGLQLTLGAFRSSYGEGLNVWIDLLSLVAGVLFSILAFSWLKARMLWRLRNRLIVTYVFIGVIPALLLIAMASITTYLFAGQFANFVVASELKSHLRSLEFVNAAVGNALAARLQRGQSAFVDLPAGSGAATEWAPRRICAWKDGTALAICKDAAKPTPFVLPRFLQTPFSGIVRDQDQLYLRAATSFKAGKETVVVISSDPLDKSLLEKLANDLGEVTLYSAGLDETALHPALTAGAAPPSTAMFDRVITFGAPQPVVSWSTGEETRSGALIRVQTRPSALYLRLFVFPDFARSVRYLLFLVMIGFAIIELLALWIGTHLTRTVTGAVAHLYAATRHINRGEFDHRVPVRSHDQLSTLGNSFNSMAESLQKLIEEQKQKQRLENELAIAQEVQAQLFPRQITQLPTLELHGFCRPARTVSGDYYDFLTIDENKLVLAVGDVSGKGISAALLMATINSAVRAYTLEGLPILREAVGAGAVRGSGPMLSLQGAEVSTASLLALLNHQLYISTPPEKYATLFLGFYDGRDRSLTYSNGGHLPPIILSQDGSIRRLESGGTVVGLFDHMTYEEGCVELRDGEIFLGYSDGVSEPENDYGEFGEQKLIELVWENRTLPLARISEIVTAAVDDWIGANEQPDDVTLVLARGR